MTALDVGANNLVACTTTTGQQYLYEGRDLFDRFRETTEEIARLQSKLRSLGFTPLNRVTDTDCCDSGYLRGVAPRA